MLVFRMAIRNLSRQASRNALSLVSIVLGVFVIVVGRGFQGGMTENMIRAQIDSASGHVLVVPIGYPTTGLRHPVEDTLRLDDTQRGWLDGHTEHWTARLIAAPRAIQGRKSMRVRLIGAGAADADVFPRTDWQVEGRMPTPGQGEILMAVGPARLLKTQVGDLLTLETRTVDGAINAMRYTVTGILRSGNPAIDNVNVYLPMDDADTLLAAEGRVTHIATLLPDRDDTAAFASAVSAELPAGEPRSWQAEIAPMLEANEVRQSMLDVIGLALLLMAATGIANTVLMAAYERVREIGTLRSMGLQRSGVLGIFALEGFWMGLAGGLVGAGLAGAFCAYYATHGIDINKLMGPKADAMSSIPVAAMLYLEFSPPTLLTSVLVAVGVSMAASLYPAWMASRVSPSEAVRPQ